MLNPYQPPDSDGGHRSFAQRFWRALRRAVTYYRTESAKDGLRIWDHVSGCGCLVFVAFAVIAIFATGIRAILPVIQQSLLP